jgi:hypothetical protein
MLLRKLQRNGCARPFPRLNVDVPTVRAHNTLNNHHAKAVASFFRRIVGLKNLGKILFRNA